MIQSFACKHTQSLFRQGDIRKFGTISHVAARKLLMLDAAMSIEDLRNPPANHLEALHGDRKGQYSIRINDQFRICFRWKEGQAYDVEIVDYH